MWHRDIAFIYKEMEAKNTELTKHLDECRVCYVWINDDTDEAPICEKRAALQNQYTNLRHRLGIN